MKHLTLFLLSMILFFSPENVFPADPSSFSIPLKNFQNRVYREKKSRFRLVSSSSRFRLVNSAFQSIRESGSRGKSHFVTVETGGLSQRVKPVTEKDLEDTPFLRLDSPELKDLAGRFSSSGKIPSEVEEFVFSYIKRKVIGIPLISSTGVIESRTGDCTEHSVLSLALLRARGVPSRAVVGVFLAPEFMRKKNVFVYHMWVEAFYRGRWLIVDATRPGEKPANRYIAFTYHSLKSPMPLTYLRAISAIQDMTITLLD